MYDDVRTGPIGMRDRKNATRIAAAEIGGHRIERLHAEGDGREEIRFSWWKDGRMQTRPLDLPERELLPLMKVAIGEQVFSEDFLQGLQSVLLDRSQPIPDDLAEDALVDMANLDQTDTGVPGTIFVSTAIGSHGPRIKWYPGAPGRKLPCLILSIGPKPVVRDSFLPDRVSRSVLPLLEAWVGLNHQDLLRFWNEGETWNRREVAALLDRLKPIPA